MKIDNSVKSSGQVASESRTRSTRDSASAPATPSTTQVALSGKLQQYDQLIAQAPVVNSDKVDEIKQAISNGQFAVHPEKVADSLIESVRQMLSSQPQSV